MSAPLPSVLGGVALTKWLESIGRPLAIGNDWVQRGMVVPTNILGELYVTREEDERFWLRARAGEFAMEIKPLEPARHAPPIADVHQNHPLAESANGGTAAVTTSNHTLQRVVERLLGAKKAGNRRPVYVTSLRQYLSQFIRGRESLPISSITTQVIENWLAQIKNPYSRQSHLNRLSALFSFAVRREMLPKNPCDAVDRVRIDRKVPVILTPNQARLLLKQCPKRCKPYLILAMFAGIRPDEIMRLDWAEVSIKTSTVSVDGKTRRRRIVPLEPVAVRLLSKHSKKAGAVAPSYSTIRRWKRVARVVLGGKWPTDVLRHTAASYLLAIYPDSAKVAMMLGNSSAILLTHYHNPVTKEAASKFWNLA